MISKADAIAGLLVQRMKQIRVVNGFNTDAGMTVYRGRIALDESKFPCVTLFEDEEFVLEQKNHDISCVVSAPFVTEGHCLCDPDNPNVAGHALVADIQKALFKDDVRLGELLIQPLMYAGRVINGRPDGQNFVTVQVKFSARFVFQPGNP